MLQKTHEYDLSRGTKTANLLFFSLFLNKVIYFWLHWVFVAARGLSLVAASGGYSSLWCMGFSLQWLLLSWSTGSRRVGSVVVVHGLSCSAACGIFPDQGSNPCPLHWQADSQPLCHQGSPANLLLTDLFQVAASHQKHRVRDSETEVHVFTNRLHVREAPTAMAVSGPGSRCMRRHDP